jgi:hypothetical protein
MPALLIKFAVRLGNEFEGLFSIYGPLFHRWLPDGQQDAIAINTGTESVDLKFWFVRRGLVRETYIEFDYGHEEVDPEMMDRQGVLDAGPLMGLLEMRGFTESEIAPIIKDETGAEDYVSLGKRVIQDWIYPWTSKLINILRIRYGQYWIRELTEWDSRRESLGAYCRNLDMMWSIDNGSTWDKFIPNTQTVTLSGQIPSGKSFLQYLTQSDWEQVKEIANLDYEPSLVASKLIRAHQLRDQGEIKHAFIEGISALELAIEDHVDQKVGGRMVLKDGLDRFYKLPLREQVIVLAGRGVDDALDDIEHAIQAIEIRNSIVHEGYSPSSDDEDKLTGLFETTALLIEQDFRFPEKHYHNMLVARSEQWEEKYSS